MRVAWFVMFSASAAAAHAASPAHHAGSSAAVAPADRLEQLDRFRDGLLPGDRRRLDAALPRSADGGIVRCDKVEGSRASCEAAAYMPALRSTGLITRFLATTRRGHF